MSDQKLAKMYNLNVNVATTSFLGLDGQCSTPRTPEIVNSLVAMTNPFDALMKPSGKGNNSPDSEESYSGTLSPLGSPTNSPPSVQHTRSQLIKEGLKLTIQTKRKHSGSESKEDLEEFESKKMKREELTEEDEERRKRRRERNKIAATKCRMKKREKTANLVSESELLETQNIELKTQIQDLQKQRRKLMDMLSMHSATCVKQNVSTVATPRGFADYVGGGGNAAESYGFETHSSYCPENQEEFEVGSTNGTAMNPYGKDPNFAKLLDDVAGSANYSRAYEKSFAPTTAAEYSDTGVQSNYYQTKNRKLESGDKLNENRSCCEYRSVKNSEKSEKAGEKVGSPFGDKDIEESDHVFRANFHCGQDADGGDNYKPNGIIDGNFFANRTDVFATGNDYATTFGTNPLDNGCMA